MSVATIWWMPPRPLRVTVGPGRCAAGHTAAREQEWTWSLQFGAKEVALDSSSSHREKHALFKRAENCTSILSHSIEKL